MGRRFRPGRCDGVQSRRLAAGIRVLRTAARFTSWRPIPDEPSLSRSANPAHVFHLAWNPRRPNLLAAGVEDNTIRIWDVDTGRQTVTLEGDSYNGLVVAFHPGGDLLASRGWNGMLRLWDIRTGSRFLDMPSSWLPELHFDRDGRRLSAPRSCPMVLGSWKSPIRPSAARWFEARDGRRAMSRRWQSTARDGIWPRQVRKGSRSGTLPSGTPLALLPVTPVVEHVQFDPSGALLTGSPLTLRWPISSGPSGTTIGPPQFLQWYQTVDGFSCSQDGRVVAEAIYVGGGLVFDPDHPTARAAFCPIVIRAASPSALTADGSSPALYAGGTLKLWDTLTGQLVHDFPEFPRPDGGRIQPRRPLAGRLRRWRAVPS